MNMLGQMLSNMGPWSWYVLGLILLGLEIFAPGAFFLWFGISAIIIGTLALFVDLAWQVNILLFLGLSIASFLYFRRYFNRKEYDSEDPLLNRRGERLLGREFELSEAIINGSGRVNIDDTVWRVNGPDLEKGSVVRIIEANGSNLRVESVASKEN